jgi:hypothetical protein
MGFWGKVQETFIEKPSEAVGKVFNPPKPKAQTKDIKTEADRQKELANQANIEAGNVAQNRALMPTMAPTTVAAPQQVASQNVAVQQAGFAGRQMGAPLAGRSAQEQALSMAQAAAEGKTPSVAEMQQKKSFEEALAQQYAMAASQGANPMAARQAAMNTATLQQQAAQSAAQLRSQEQAQARGELAAVGGQMATQDIQRMSSDQQTIINEQAQILEAQGMNQQSALDAAKANQSAALQTAITQGNLTSAEGQQNIENWLKLQGLNDGMIQFYKSQALTGQLTAADLIKNISSLKSGAGAVGSQMQQQANAGMLQAGATALAAYLGKSDKNAKENIQPGKGREWVRTLGSHEYNYKEGHGEDSSVRHVGVMAQDIEKTRPDMITKDGMGDKVVNYGKGFGAMLATMYELDRDLKDLEESFKKRVKSNKDKK